jgi:hypothetical protein
LPAAAAAEEAGTPHRRDTPPYEDKSGGGNFELFSAGWIRAF